MELSTAMEGMAKGGLGAAEDRAYSHRNGTDHRRMLDITRDKPIKLAVRVAVPVRDHPKFNFVGKLLGPKGNSMKRLQEETMCKMAVLGRGSMKDRQKEEEYRLSGDPRYAHLSEDLHVEISAFAAPAEAHARIAYALAEVRRFLVPDYHDDIRQEQMWEMHALCTQPPTGGLTGTGASLTGTEGVADGVENEIPPCEALSTVSDEMGSSDLAVQTEHPIECCEMTGPQGTPPHPALRGVKIGNGAGALARKRPLLGGPRASMSPTKRTVMSLLARARQAQALHTQRNSENLLLREVTPPQSLVSNSESVIKVLTDST